MVIEMLSGTRYAARWRRLPLSMRAGSYGAKAATFQRCRGMFSFVNNADQERVDLVSRSREALRQLGKHDDLVTLHLPFSPSSSRAGDILTRLPLGLETLQKTALLEVHNPSARNALSGKMMAQLADIVSVLEDPQLHQKLNTIVLKGTGGWFCAGADLRVAQQKLNSREAGAAMGTLMVDTLTRFRRLPLMSVAIIEGGAIGGGAELATACDFRVMEKNSVIQFVQSRMGVVPGWGGGARLYKIVGRQNALRLLCTAEKISPERAMELKLADDVFSAASEEDLNSAISAFVEPFDGVATPVSHGAKRVINNADDVSVDVLEYEHDVFKTLWGGPANLEALKKALAKKK
uniref:Ethylmalonyl-CoA decarboxylase n=1 Tax=Phytophthora ramorum TaxID=164328 RepID=H3H1T3_PHYRM